MNVVQRRNGLTRLQKALAKRSITLGFIGGSITEQSYENRWPEYVSAWFTERFKGVQINIENAAIGATGSELAVFRAQRDLIDRNCDIVFIEFAVNDFDQTSEKRMRTREGLIRKLLAEERDIVLVYTFRQEMYDDMIQEKIPDSIKEFEELASYYGIGSVWMGLHALNEVKKGMMKWEEWLPDGLHPQYRGSLSYANSVISYLEKELIEDPNNLGIPAGVKVAEPLNPSNWENTCFIPFSEIKLNGPWTIRRWSKMAWVDQILDTAAVGAGLTFSFKGRGVCLGFDFGRFSSEFRYRIDGGDWIDVVRERPWWCPDQGWYRITTIEDDLPYGNHVINLEVTHGNREECKGTNFRLAFIGVIL